MSVTRRVSGSVAQVFSSHQQSVQRGPPAAQRLLAVLHRQNQRTLRETATLLPQLQL